MNTTKDCKSLATKDQLVPGMPLLDAAGYATIVHGDSLSISPARSLTAESILSEPVPGPLLSQENDHLPYTEENVDKARGAFSFVIDPAAGDDHARLRQLPDPPVATATANVDESSKRMTLSGPNKSRSFEDNSGYVLDLPPIPPTSQPQAVNPVTPVGVIYDNASITNRSAMRRQSSMALTTLSESDWMSINIGTNNNISSPPVSPRPYTPLQSSRAKLSVTYDTPSKLYKHNVNGRGKRGVAFERCFKIVLVLGVVLSAAIGIAGWCHTIWKVENLEGNFERCSEGKWMSLPTEQVGVASFTSGMLPFNITVKDLIDDVMMTSQTINQVLFYVVVQSCMSNSDSTVSHSDSIGSGTGSCSNSFCNVELAMTGEEASLSYAKYIAVAATSGHVTSNNMWFPLATDGVLYVSTLESCNVTVSIKLIGFC